MKKLFKYTILLLVILFVVELYLRFYWGFCDSVLMQYSSRYEYIEQPNQNRFRFRKHIRYNSFSMRSDEVDSTALTILGFGDSIFNGGVQVDQDSIASSILSKDLSKELGYKTQVLNVSAGSWGPDNCFAYLKEKGDFNSKLIFLVVSSHDAYDVMDFMPVIDKVDRYESKQYRSAIWELISRYAIPRVMKNFPSDVVGIANKSNKFNPGFADFANYCQQNRKPFFIYLNPDTTEVNAGKYKPEGEKIKDFCKSNQIECIEGLGHTQLEDYRGVIHLNESGQRKMAELIKNAIIHRKENLPTKNKVR